jgi:hypothetical protein
MQFDALVHETSSRKLVSEPFTFGLATIDHDGAAPAGDANPTSEPQISAIVTAAAEIRRPRRCTP